LVWLVMRSCKQSTASCIRCDVCSVADMTQSPQLDGECNLHLGIWHVAHNASGISPYTQHKCVSRGAAPNHYHGCPAMRSVHLCCSTAAQHGRTAASVNGPSLWCLPH
jgi:hypothetical protein